MGDHYSPQGMGVLRVGLLGPFRATVGDVSLVAGGVKQRAVLAMLALRAGETVPESRLIDGIWGDELPSTVRSALQVYVAHWRRVLAEAGCGARIDRDGAGYRLTMDPADVDTNRFSTLLAHARRALDEGRSSLAVTRYEEAIALWRGDALQDFGAMPFHTWETVSLDAARVQAEADHVEALLTSGQGGELIAPLEGLVARYPYEERFRSALMHALYRTGRQVEALRVVTAAREALAEVGLDIGSGLRVMEQRILQQDPELDAQTLPFTPPPPPEPLSSLIGRDREVNELVDVVSQGETRLVALLGPGGVGKSRLALEVANRVRDEGWMPVAYASVVDTTDPSLVPILINESFGVPESWRERPVRHVATLLARTPALVVIDGAEHVLEAVRDAVADLLRYGREVRVLVTSRTATGLAGERPLVVEPLRVEPTEGESLRCVPAVCLFMERAEQFQTGVRFGESEITGIQEICRAVDSLPLAIELAAARSGTLGVDGLRRRLGARLDVVASSRVTSEPRHGSLREVIAWSHDLLSPDAQKLMARLSVFSGGFTASHVEGLWADSDRLRLVTAFEELERHSLFTRMAGGREPRFRMLDTVTEFARERLVDLGEVDDAFRRLSRWLLEAIDSAGGRVGAGTSQFEDLEPEVDNVRTAIAWMLTHDEVDIAADLCLRLYVWWMTCGRGEELGRWIGALVPTMSNPSPCRAYLLTYLGRIHGRWDRFDKSTDYLEQARNEFSNLGLRDGVVHACTSLVENLVHLGDLSRARKLSAEALGLSVDSESLEIKCRALHSALWAQGVSGDYVAALTTGSELLSLTRMSGLTDFEARTLADLAWCARLAGDADAAHSWAALAVQVAERAATGGAVVSANTELALANIQLDRCADALAAIERGLNFESGDDLSPSSILRLSLALCLAAQRLSEERLEGAALGVSEAAIRAEPNVGVWPADWSMVGKLFLSIKEGIQHPGDGQASSDPVAKARALGLMLPALLQPGTR